MLDDRRVAVQQFILAEVVHHKLGVKEWRATNTVSDRIESNVAHSGQLHIRGTRGSRDRLDTRSSRLHGYSTKGPAPPPNVGPPHLHWMEPRRAAAGGL